jgi:hypothetical protein
MDFATIGRFAQQRFGWTLFTAMRYLPESDEVERVHTSDAAAYPLGGRKRKRDTEWSRKVLVHGEPNFAADADALRAAFDDAEKILALGIGTLINVPVRDAADGRVIGTLNFGREPGGYTAGHVAPALALAALAAPLFQSALIPASLMILPQRS